MPTKVFGSTSRNTESKIDISLFVEKRYLGINYIESNIEENIDK